MQHICFKRNSPYQSDTFKGALRPKKILRLMSMEGAAGAVAGK